MHAEKPRYLIRIASKSQNHYHHPSRRHWIWFSAEGSSQIMKIRMMAPRPCLGVGPPIFPDKHSVNEGEKDLLMVTFGHLLIKIDKGFRRGCFFLANIQQRCFLRLGYCHQWTQNFILEALSNYCFCGQFRCSFDASFFYTETWGVCQWGIRPNFTNPAVALIVVGHCLLEGVVVSSVDHSLWNE